MTTNWQLLNSQNQILVDKIEGGIPEKINDGDVLEVSGQIQQSDEMTILGKDFYVHPRYFDLKEYEDMVDLLYHYAKRAKL